MPKGLSNGVQVKYGSSFHRSLKSITLKPNKTGKEIRKQKETERAQIAALNFEQRQELIEVDHGAETQYQFMDIDCDDNNDYEDIETVYGTFPPGEEALLQSHAGGEAIFQQIFNHFRVRKERVQLAINKWMLQMDRLIDAYLQYKARGPIPVDETCSWPLNVLSFSETGIRMFSHSDDASRGNQTLLKHGYLGSSPESPALAFPLEFLEQFRQIHRVCPRFSFDALSKALSHLHKVPRKKYLRDQLSDAYDAYLAILRGVEERVQKALKREDDWYMKNVCPPCFYKTVGEPPLKYSALGAMDGNNSLKLVDATFQSGTPRTDTRRSTSFRWLTPQQVDRFQDEVENSKKRKSAPIPENSATQSAPSAPTAPVSDMPSTETMDESVPAPPSEFNGDQDGDEDIAWLNVNELEGSAVDDLTKCINACVDRWRAAGPEARKKMFALFAIAGIFISVCRHGHVTVMCDMIRSGELMKYPLAISNHIMDTYGEDYVLGYDIMCAFFKTLQHSSLGAKTVALRLRGVVPAFHGHAHNRECQIGWHPLYVEGVGLEDFEECERTFAKSNNLASITRLSSPFHRQQQIDEHFYFHDLDKHASSGNFIFQNYRQALEKISASTQLLEDLERALKTCGEDYEKYLNDEKEYFLSRKSEPPEVAETVQYMDLLIKLRDVKEERDKAKIEHQKLDYNIVINAYTRPQIALVNRRYNSTHERLLLVEDEVCEYEADHKITERWLPGSKNYEEALVLLSERSYKLALDKLESLVVKRLFELTKLGMSGVGYKLREKISKALRTRAEAIRAALQKYNLAAVQLNPPRARLTWTSVIETVSLAAFDLLRDTRTDIRKLPWAQPANREAMVLYFGIKRAKEEIRRLNVEIVRLLSFMVDEHVDYVRAIRNHIMVAPDLAHELSQQWMQRTRINESIVFKLLKTSHLPGFSGSMFPANRVGRDESLNANETLPVWATHHLGLTRETVEYDEPDSDDDIPRELEGADEHMVDLMERLTTIDVQEMDAE
ncbi:hypothetical protein B0H10DRAFT_2229907 [Mycena sp. CBHHK59/15]|nr:hypothetical protein B0H10DRAFT_2242077 [Mycena sp. CBHHK59/15]KAJ6603161.1 hypothetical protein B0H10DRAFT_2229907 [Mycena sp. CBHHK59/15]